MIEGSRRRRGDARVEPLTLHQRLAWGEAWNRRLTVGSVAALAASVVAWLLGAPLPWHAGAVLAGFVSGTAWPVPDPTERALGWIAERSGLAYETALQPRDDDGWGFRQAVDEQAKAVAARLPAPSRQRWWIAVVAVAVGLLLLPAAQLVRPGGVPATDVPPGEAAEAPAPEPMPEDPLVPPEEPDELDRVTEPEGRDGAAASDRSPGAGAGAPSEEETLSRLMDNLRERDPFRPVNEPPEEPGAPPESQQSQEQPGERAPGAQEADGRQRSEASEGQQAGDPGEGAGERSEGDDEGQQGAPEEGGDEGQQEGEEEGQPGPTQGEEPGEPQPGETPAGGNEPGQDEGQLQPNASPGVGDGPSAIQPTEGLEGEPQMEPEFLPGQLEAGPENPGGTVLLPGEDDIDVPMELRRDEYRRAVEEAVTDGRVPLEYQEIIRNYFR